MMFLLNTSISLLTFNGITIRTRLTTAGRVQYFAPDMAKSCGKEWRDYNRLESTQTYINYLISHFTSVGICTDELCITVDVGPNENRGTWIDEDLAIHFAQWLSPRFAHQVILWTKELLTNGTVSLKSTVSEKLKLAEINRETAQKSLDETAIKVFQNQLESAKKAGNLRLVDFYEKALVQYTQARFVNELVTPALPERQSEGVVDVAIRLGLNVPRNLESSLGRYVKKHAGHLILKTNCGSELKDNRFSQASGKQVPAIMYPKGNSLVESLVREYLESKGVI